jgi:uroporphyrinogen decarboxylase
MSVPFAVVDEMDRAEIGREAAVIYSEFKPPRNARTRFLRACRCLPVDRPPIWMMRQAGRSLPEYRKLKEKHSFLELAQTPELAAEVTLQPIRRFNFDAAIIFSDILVIPEAMGVPYSFRESGGVQMEFQIRSEADIQRLSGDAIAERLHYVTDAIRLVKRELHGRTALLGFAGSPWTLANYMLDGGSAKEHTRGLALFRENRALFEQLCNKLTSAVITFLRMQICAGVDVIQIFDSLGGRLPGADFRAASGVWIREIVAALANEVPTIVFSKGTRQWIDLAHAGTEVVGVDYDVSLTEARAQLGPGIALQGNLDPTHLVTDTPNLIQERVKGLLHEMSGEEGYIFNLGHGVLPNSRLENIEAIVETVRAAGRSTREPSRQINPNTAASLGR